MADPRKQLPYNVSGEFFVDSTCINCDTCRQLAPEVFEELDDEYSYVCAQPQSELSQRNALRALLACPTGSIGTFGSNRAKEVMNDFPFLIEDDVYYCGFASPKSFGGSSYFIQHQDGNWLIDSPKFIPHLMRQFEDVGGVNYIFLTHRDDVADAHKYAKHFGAQRIIHRKELSAQPDAEIVIDGDEPIQLFPRPNNGEGQADFLVIPTPGHTQGHCVLLYNTCLLRNRYTLSSVCLIINSSGFFPSVSICQKTRCDENCSTSFAFSTVGILRKESFGHPFGTIMPLLTSISLSFSSKNSYLHSQC